MDEGAGLEQTYGLEQAAEVLRFANQHTLTQPFELSGVGLHTGAIVAVAVYPAPAFAGRYFVRTDLEDAVIPARIAFLQQTRLSTELGTNSGAIRTVEHVLAALCGLGIDNARIEVNGSEMPLLDGSAQEWARQILSVGWRQQAALRQIYTVTEPVVVRQGDAFVAAVPAAQTRLTYGIEFSHPAVGQQWHSIQPENFLADVAPARTFGFASEVEKLRESGLIKGGSLENALVCGDAGWLNPPLRYPNEPVRHKLLDLIGDLSLMGRLPRAHVLAYKASHALHTQLVRRLVDLQEPTPAGSLSGKGLEPTS